MRVWPLLLLAFCLGQKQLPNPMLAGYANWGECDDRVVLAARQGVNVVLWFSIDLSPSAPPSGGPNLTCVASVKANLTAAGLPTTHLITVGGWDAPHPTGGAPADFYAQWKAWNLALAPGGLFDGIDWDLEGNDAPASPWNTISLDTLQIVGEVSQAAKRDGFLVTMVPAESYLDASTPLFDLSLTNAYPEAWHPEFRYHGRNAYAYLYSRYGGAQTFDAVTIQLYESFSHAGYNVSVLKQRPADYLVAWARSLARGYAVDFASVPQLQWPTQTVQLPPSTLVVGLSNGWAGGAGAPKSLLIMPEEVGVAWAALGAERFRGAAFWCIAEEGATPPAQSQPLFLAAGLNAFMGTRPPLKSEGGGVE